jgi:hypothetical protein
MKTFTSATRKVPLATWKLSVGAVRRFNGRAAVLVLILIAVGLVWRIDRAESQQSAQPGEDALVISPDGTVTLNSVINLPPTTATAGVITQNGTRVMHSFGSLNFFAGQGAGNFTMSGGSNVAIGQGAFQSNTTGDYNTACGTESLYNNTMGQENTACGALALFQNTTGTYNTACGPEALQSNTTGSSNIALGHQAGNALTTGDNNICIGHAGAAKESGVIRIGTPDTHKTTLLVGNVGIGTSTPTQAKLVVEGGGPAGSVVPEGTAYTLFGQYNGLITNATSKDTQSASIKASHSILAGNFCAVSDARIKNIQGRSDAAADLATLSRIEITDYRYKDVVGNGNRPHKKVIAQQVAAVYPQAVSHSADIVPDIYQTATIKDGWVQLATDLKQGDRVRLIGEKKQGIHEVLEVAEGNFRTDFAADGDVVFVYGRVVNDCGSVDYDAIAMLNVSATQELARKLEIKDQEVKALQDENASLLARLERLERIVNRLTAVESKLASDQTVIERAR